MPEYPADPGDVPAESETEQAVVASKSYPYEDGDTLVLGPELFTGLPGTPGDGVIAWKGENFYRTHDGKPPVVKEKDPHPPLKQYKVGEFVEVLKNGDWTSGRISSIQAGTVNVDTERGPVGVGGNLRIRKI